VTAFAVAFKVYTIPCLRDNGEEMYNTRWSGFATRYLLSVKRAFGY
jgi:hypothetical protein